MTYLLKAVEFAKRLLLGLTRPAPKYLTAFLFTIVFMQVITIRADTSLPTIPNPRVFVNGHSGTTIIFSESNSRSSRSRSLPHLVLLRNGKLTEPGERTLLAVLYQLKSPPTIQSRARRRISRNGSWFGKKPGG
jgi:hypothetical protein